MMKSHFSRILYFSLTFLSLSSSLLLSCSKKNETSPILLLATQREFGLYTGEILKTEGFNTFETDSIANPGLTTNYLNDFDIVILAETEITSAQQELLTRYVEEGGNLIAFRPDKKLSNVFGIGDTDSETGEGYLSINTSNEMGNGITTETLQFHGTADHVTLKRWRGDSQTIHKRHYCDGISRCCDECVRQGKSARILIQPSKKYCIHPAGKSTGCGNGNGWYHGHPRHGLIHQWPCK